ncbi:MAG: SMI1/KNR4 family protein [Zoogloeaceae bacterium]|nr:SMI1/KNR4 family protein [Zoogloeaceae bacterium]
MANETPPLVWPTFSDNEARLEWWLACAKAYAEFWKYPVRPASHAELDALEQRLGCSLPPLLRAYHARSGMLGFGDDWLASVTPVVGYDCIAPLKDYFPGVSDILEDEPDAEQQWALVNELVAFGGTNNMWCFHRQTGEVWYCDHDTPPWFTQMFADVGGLFDALAFICLLDLHQSNDKTLLRQHLGDAVVDKWMY